MPTSPNTIGSPKPPSPPLLPVQPQLQLDQDLPSDVSTEAQLALLPAECLSGNPARPLRHVDAHGRESTYLLHPQQHYVIALILAVELMERFAYYGVYYTLTMYLTGVYNADYNAGLTSVQAAAYVSTSTAVAYTTPFVGALLADAVLGDYWSICVGACGLYLPGLLLVALTSVPGLLGSDNDDAVNDALTVVDDDTALESSNFPNRALSIAVLGLWPLGTGLVKSVVNVFGAKQHHPILQSAFIERYYVNFYTSINVGALAGITLLPILAQTNVSAAYSLPVALLCIGVGFFLAGSSHYVVSPPSGNLKIGSGKKRSTTTPSDTIPLLTILRISLLIVPFCIAYSQMPTTFIVQGTVMRKAFGFIDAATMNSLDALSVLFFGYLTGSHIFPALARRQIKLPTTYKFAIGSTLGALSIVWALVVESMIRSAYDRDGSTISVVWQAPSYILIGFGEILVVSTAYEVAFTASAPETKALASAINIFCVGGIPNLVCISLFNACQGWFRNSRGTMNLHYVEDYATAHVDYYFWLLVSILVGGILLNASTPVRDFVEATETKATNLVKTPMLRRPIDEGTPLLRRKFGDGPNLTKMGSMRAGPPMTSKGRGPRKVKYSLISRLYKSTDRTAAANPTLERQNSL